MLPLGYHLREGVHKLITTLSPLQRLERYAANKDRAALLKVCEEYKAGLLIDIELLDRVTAIILGSEDE